MPQVSLATRFDEVQHLIFAEKFGAADARIAQLAADYPDSALVAYLEALSNLHQGRPKQAEIAAHRALALDPDDADALYLLAGAQLAQGHYEAALETTDEAIELAPQQAHFFARRAQVFLATGQLPLAEIAAREGLARDPESESCRNLLALALNYQGKRVAAAEEVRDLLALNPANPVSHANAGFVALRAGQTETARGFFVEALRLDPTDQFARMGLAEVVKAANPLYRYFLRFSVWMSEIAVRYRWGLIIGLLVLVRFVPALVPLYLVFVLWTYYANPLANGYLQLHATGRYLIEESDRPYVVATVVCLALALLSGVAAWLGPVDSLRFVAFGGLLAVLPLNRLVVAPDRGGVRRFAYAWLGVAAGLGLLGATAPLWGWGEAAFESLFLLAAVAYSWLGNLVR